MFRIMTGKNDVSHSTWFQTMTDIRGDGVGTRQGSGFLNVLPKASESQIRKNFFSTRVVEPWNRLPDSVKAAESVNQFKNSLDEYLR